MTTAYNGRIFNAAVGEGKPFEIVWDGQIYENEMYAIPKGAPNKDEALEFIKFATSTEGLQAQAKQISYGPARKSANATEIIYKDGKTVMAPHLPTAPGQHEERAGILVRVLGRPGRRTERALQRLARRELMLTPGAGARPRAAFHSTETDDGRRWPMPPPQRC